MDLWIEVRRVAAVFLDRHGLLAACVALLLEEAGIPVPFAPGDLVMVLLGIRARRGVLSLWQVIAALEGATLVGASLLYFLARRAGRATLYRYGRFLHVTPNRVARAESWLRRHGALAIVVARLVPGCRIMAAVGCGVLGVPPRIFIPSMGVGALLSIILFTLLGYYLGPPVLRVVERVPLPIGFLGSCVALIALLVWIVQARRALTAMRRERGYQAGAGRIAAAHGALNPGRRLRAGATAGALATVAATVLMDVLVHVAGGLAFLAPGTLAAATARQLPLDMARHGALLAILAAVPAYLAVGVVLGAAYGYWVEHHLRLPDWAKGAVFAAAPLAAALLIVLPLLGMGLPGSHAQEVFAAGETIRHAAYGLLLGLTYPIFLSRRLALVATPPPAQDPTGTIPSAA